ncbi:serine/threonine-protein kinase [Hyalangium gracile]|uniref:serine/threonine-protein kinase n=1 Tax=Hyalangium gracile TaxID=394092 RepID=UPI001CCFE809|nr:serine/threonine-protein kinase [Hyalangium gracile]
MANQLTYAVQGALPASTQIGHWRVQEVLGKGAFGTVYGVERAEAAEAGAFALKLASTPDDPRFEREVELLSRIRHPQVPRLHEHGWWTHPSGVAFPYLVMDRIEGRTLYQWASERPRTSRQVMRLLADLAWALDATHRADCVHRDVKGENVLVSPEGRAFLMDFGAGDFKGARTLTRELLPPGTPYYRSPQALRFHWVHRHERGAHYEPGPADDVYALGVTAYVLVTGGYPPCRVEPQWDKEPAKLPPSLPLPPLSEFATVCPELDALILRMLSDEPEARGSAGEVAHALEHAGNPASPKADVPIVPRESGSASDGKHASSSSRGRSLKTLGIASSAAGILLAAAAWWGTQLDWEGLSGAQEERHSVSEDRGIVAVGDGARLVSTNSSPHQTPSMGLGLDMPKKPLPGQRVPPCREGFEVEIELTEGQKDTRSCWIKGDVQGSACKAHGYEYRGGCYAPSYPPPKLPQSMRP